MSDSIKRDNKLIPLYFVAFFVGLAILDGIFVYLAVSTQNGLVTENAYEKGLNYNEAIEKAEGTKDTAQDIAFEALGNREAKIYYSNENDLKSAKLMAIRPVEDGKDFELELQKNVNEPAYSANITFPEKGVWDILVIAETENAEFRKKKRVFIK